MITHILLLLTSEITKEPINIVPKDNMINITCSIDIKNINNYILTNNINKVKDIINIYDNVTNIDITFDKNIKNEMLVNNILL